METAAKHNSMGDFIRSAGVTMRTVRTDSNPNACYDTAGGLSHWRCTLRAGRSTATVYFSMGPALTGPPTAVDVLDCLASDAAGFENAQDFEDWCSEYGFNPDSRKAERTYRASARQSASLRRLLGDSAYDTLLWHTERM